VKEVMQTLLTKTQSNSLGLLFVRDSLTGHNPYKLQQCDTIPAAGDGNASCACSQRIRPSKRRNSATLPCRHCNPKQRQGNIYPCLEHNHTLLFLTLISAHNLMLVQGCVRVREFITTAGKEMQTLKTDPRRILSFPTAVPLNSERKYPAT
jgi:hypothetical protein